jgi:hypothetical protein
MNKGKRNVFLALACGMFGLASPFPSLAEYTREPGVVFLGQGWSDEDRLRYYYTSQGSAAVPYDIFLNLETANGRGLFRSDENVAGYGLVPQPADPK